MNAAEILKRARGTKFEHRARVQFVGGEIEECQWTGEAQMLDWLTTTMQGRQVKWFEQTTRVTYP